MFSSLIAKRHCTQAAALALLATAFNAHAAAWSEDFNTVLPTGWTATNNSFALGSESWFQGNVGIFSAQAGADNSYAAANLNSAGGTVPATISNWLITPSFSYASGDTLSFWTRTEAGSAFFDRLEVRFSAVGGVNVGTSETSVGDFSNLLLTVNPGFTATGYPDAWAKFSVALPSAATGAFAFRYYVTDAGPSGSNSSYIGIDSVAVTPVPEPATYLLAAMGLGVIALRRRQIARR
jgi:PEP-CTERM motif